jgi:hypothetical protein
MDVGCASSGLLQPGNEKKRSFEVRSFAGFNGYIYLIVRFKKGRYTSTRDCI